MWNLNVKSQKPESVVRVHDQGQGSVGQWHGFVRCRSPIPARHETSWRQLHCDCPRPRPDLVGWKGWGLINYIKPSQSQIIVSMCFWWVWWAKKENMVNEAKKHCWDFFRLSPWCWGSVKFRAISYTSIALHQLDNPKITNTCFLFPGYTHSRYWVGNERHIL